MAEDAVDSCHPEYKDAQPKWQKCRVATAGEEAVHAAGEVFLPKLLGQSKDEYEAYKQRALFYNATGRTVDGMSGLVFRRPPTIDIPAAIEYLKEDADTAGTPLLAFSEKVVEELLQVGRVGILADYPRLDGMLTLADQRAANGRPYLKTYAAESILNWRVERVNNRSMLTLVVLAEVHEVAQGFTTVQTPQCRVLRLQPGAADHITGVAGWRYDVEIWRKVKDAASGQEEWQRVEAFTPMMGGNALPYIPFVICGPIGSDPAVAKPPILDLANVNLSHYRSSADYEHGLHFTGLPTPVVTGHSFDGDVGTGGSGQATFALGSSTIQAFPNPNAEVKFLEFTGQGLRQLADRLREKESMMAALGARMLAAEKRQAEAAESLAIHRSGENSVLASLALAASGAISKAIGWCAEWESVAGPARVELNTEYLPTGMTPDELAELVNAWQSGAISHLTLLDNLQRGELTRQGVTPEQEIAQIKTEPPPPGPPQKPLPMLPGGNKPQDA